MPSVIYQSQDRVLGPLHWLQVIVTHLKDR
jgi:hypothetical protein